MQAKSIQDIYDALVTCFRGLPGMGEFDDPALAGWQEGGVLRSLFMSIAMMVGQGWVEMEDVWSTIFATTADREGLRFHGADYNLTLKESDKTEEWRNQVLSRIQQPEVGTPPWYAQECKRQFAEVQEAALIITATAVNSGYLLIQTRGAVTRASLISDIQTYFDAEERKLGGFDLTVMALDDWLESRQRREEVA